MKGLLFELERSARMGLYLVRTFQQRTHYCKIKEMVLIDIEFEDKSIYIDNFG